MANGNLGETGMRNAWRGATILGGPLIALALSACGVKGLPNAPESDRPPVGITEADQSGGTQIIGMNRTRTTSPLAAPRIGQVTTGSERQVGASEIARTPGATRKSFFLDPLLN
ncbi:hypothetical protein DYI37_06860 [Fulvimarina endophytica]|uniref:Lipoprotein n=1 Tax=Fulvimarina endophytica TaxID=2293836 RepID=A0A371X4E1_9HYPH|nr:hypothetical protein [Fulvimarina endophytica]RFC64077.1 hypothetical protein DYI37_06860 [Fulvimarina endophytica]